MAGILFVIGLGSASVAAGAESATPEEAIVKMREAVRFLHQKGTSALAEFNNSAGRWVWKDRYVFVYDCRLDKMIAHPIRPDLVGRSIMQIKDYSGRFIFKDLCKAGAEARRGWVEYLWPKPGAGNLSRKLSYALAADVAFATGIQVGAGVYDDKLTLPELGQLLERMSDPSTYPAL